MPLNQYDMEAIGRTCRRMKLPRILAAAFAKSMARERGWSRKDRAEDHALNGWDFESDIRQADGIK